MPTKRRFDFYGIFQKLLLWKNSELPLGNLWRRFLSFFHSYSLWSEIPEMKLPLKSPAMTLFFFQTLVFCSEVVYTLFPDADKVAKNPKVSHFDCGAKTENTLYALVQVWQCHITPEELEISQRKIILYIKRFRKELNAAKCRVKHQREKWHYGHNNYSSIDHTIAGITSDLVISPEQCRSLAKAKMIYLADQVLGVEYDIKKPMVIIDGSTSDDNRNHCTSGGWITQDTFLPYMQRTTLKARMSTGKVLSDSAQVLPLCSGRARLWDYFIGSLCLH